jgi:hypothetical protein
VLLTGEGMGSTGVALRASWKETLHPFHAHASKQNAHAREHDKSTGYKTLLTHVSKVLWPLSRLYDNH